MKKITFTTEIKASKEIVWSTLWDDKTYRLWTSVFSPDSHAVSDWKEGSTIQFIDNSGNGMSSIIDTNNPYDKMSFKHLGELKNSVQLNSGWAGAMEEYFLEESGAVTLLTVKMDVTESFEKTMSGMFPKALEIVKQLSEKHKNVQYD